MLIRWGQYNVGDIRGESSSTEKMIRIAQLMSKRPANSDWVIDVRTNLAGYQSESVGEEENRRLRAESIREEENRRRRW